jgi:hypothetical protein
LAKRVSSIKRLIILLILPLAILLILSFFGRELRAILNQKINDKEFRIYIWSIPRTVRFSEFGGPSEPSIFERSFVVDMDAISISS